jgi:hypothetical protein
MTKYEFTLLCYSLPPNTMAMYGAVSIYLQELSNQLYIPVPLALANFQYPLVIRLGSTRARSDAGPARLNPIPLSSSPLPSQYSNWSILAQWCLH